MTRRTVTISMQPELLRRLDDYRDQAGLSRSSVIVSCLLALIEAFEKRLEKERLSGRIEVLRK